jgi:TrkA-N domain/RyR domain
MRLSALSHVGAPAPPRPWHHRLRRVWRVSVRARWRTIRAPLLLGTAVMSLVLGTIGYLQLTSVTPSYGFLDALYRSITLFAFGGTAPPPIPVTLQIARITAPVLTGYAALGTVLALSRAQARVLGIRLFIRNHVIICGLGQTGGRLAAALVDQVPVVVIESNPSAGQIAGARLRGISVLGGNASDPAVLRQAGIGRARTLVVACGSAAVNVDVAAAASRSLTAEPRRRPLRVFAHLENLDLWSSLAAESTTFAAQRPDFRLQFFNVMAIGAQLLADREPPFAPGSPRSAHVLIVGLQGIGEQLVLALARLTAAERAGDDARLKVTLTGDRAEDDLERLLARYPTLPGYLRLGTRRHAVESAAFQAGAPMFGADGRADVTRAYVTLDDEADGLQAALALHSVPETIGVPVTVVVADATAGVAAILGSDRGRLAHITAFGAISEATSQRLLLLGINETVARAQHAQWLRTMERTGGAAAGENPNFKPWDQLSDEQKEFNRRFADDINAKLDRIGGIVVPMALPDPAGERFAFSAAELEQLSRDEHERWAAQRVRDGWTYGRHRDDARKLHDELKPYDELDEQTRDKDRAAVARIPATLAAAGYAIRRTGDAGTVRGSVHP